MTMYCDNQAAIFIANNLTFHERTKHIEVHYHYIKDLVLSGHISTPYTQPFNQLADIFTKGVSVGLFENLCIKLGMLNIFDPA